MFKLFTDGGSRNNPGPAAVGAVLYAEDGSELDTISEYIGTESNNVAEYTAVIRGLEVAQQHDVTELACYLDSELVVRQLNGEYKVKDKNLAKLFARVWNLKESFKKISFEHVRRAQNARADELVNQALDNHVE